MGIGGGRRQRTDMDNRSDSHYEAADKSLFPPDVANDLKAAMEARNLSPQQAAEAIGIAPKIVMQISKGESPKGARKVKAKVKAWLATVSETEGEVTDDKK